MSIDFPETGKSLSRKVVTRSRARPTGKYPSWKMNRMIQWESHHELNVYRLLDMDPSVQSFYEQPLKITYQLNGEKRSHFPDVLVIINTTKELWEIKTESEARVPETIKRTDLMMRTLPEWGYAYKMVYADVLVKKYSLANALTILKFGRQEMPLIARQQLYANLSNLKEFTWGDVISKRFGANSRNQICRLILEGVLDFDMEDSLISSTILRLKKTLYVTERQK